MKFIWHETGTELTLRFGSRIRGLQKHGKRPDVCIIKEEELWDFKGDTKPFITEIKTCLQYRGPIIGLYNPTQGTLRLESVGTIQGQRAELIAVDDLQQQ